MTFSSCAKVIVDGFVQNDLHRVSTIYDHCYHGEVSGAASLSCFPGTSHLVLSEAMLGTGS